MDNPNLCQEQVCFPVVNVLYNRNPGIYQGCQDHSFTKTRKGEYAHETAC